MMKIRDDERFLLAISRPGGRLAECSAISPSRMTGIRRKWTLLGWLEPGSDLLTRKAMWCKVALPEILPIEPVEVAVEVTVPDPVPVWQPELLRAWDATDAAPDESEDLDEPDEDLEEPVPMTDECDE